MADKGVVGARELGRRGAEGGKFVRRSDSFGMREPKTGREVRDRAVLRVLREVYPLQGGGSVRSLSCYSGLPEVQVRRSLRRLRRAGLVSLLETPGLTFYVPAP